MMIAALKVLRYQREVEVISWSFFFLWIRAVSSEGVFPAAKMTWGVAADLLRTAGSIVFTRFSHIFSIF